MARVLKELLLRQEQLTRTSFHWFRSTAANTRVVLATQQFETNDNSELKVVQTMLEALQLEGVVFTMDALHCQKNYGAHY